MNRRRYLQATGAAAVPLVAGCLGEGDGNTVLDRPDDQRADSEDLAYPAHGQRLPEATVPSPLQDREVTTTAFEGERHVLLTFGYTRCHDVCPVLTAALAQVQADAAERGYADEVALLPTTFDPVYDTEPVLREFSVDVGADPALDNWDFLRPETEERARAVVDDTFGVAFQKTDAYEPDGQPEEMPFVHGSLILLANVDGYVERAYYGEPPLPVDLIDDLDAVRDGFA